MNIKNLTLFSILLSALFYGSCTQAQDLKLYTENHNIYAQCRSDLEEYKENTSFVSSSCANYIFGFLSGFQMSSLMHVHRILDDQAREQYDENLIKNEGTICLSKISQSAQLPRDLALNYVQFYDHIEHAEVQPPKTPESILFLEALKEHFSCSSDNDLKQ